MNERAGYVDTLELSQAAQEALQNRAVMAYFEDVERKAIDALLGVDLAGDPATWLRLTTVAQTTRKLRTYLQEARDLREYAEEMLRRIDKEQGDG